MNQEELFARLAKSLTYAGVVHKQSTYLTDQNEFDNEFVLEYKHSEIQGDSLLFFVPSVSSNQSGPCYLNIRTPYVSPQDGETVLYSSHRMDLVTETNDGVIRPAGQGDVIANRMCIIRFDLPSNRAILINSPLHGDAAFTSVTATDANFLNRPKVRDPETVNGYVDVATAVDIANLEARIAALEGRIVYGTQDEEEALASLPTGTIYIKLNED